MNKTKELNQQKIQEQRHIKFMVSLNTEQKAYFKEMREKLMQRDRKLLSKENIPLDELYKHTVGNMEILFGDLEE